MILKILTIVTVFVARLAECFPQSLVTTGVGPTEVSSGGQVLPLEITKFHVNSTIQFRYARTQVVSHVKNPGTAPNKADFTVVIPDSAFISNFSMIIKGVEYVAEVKEKEEAKKDFDEAVSDGRGAGIVSKETRDANIFTVATNIEPGQKVVFKLIYEELLDRKAGMYEHAINIDPKQIVDDLRVEVFINESLPISKISVPELVQSNEIDASDEEESKIADVERNVDGYANNAKIVFAPDKLYQEEAGAQGISGQFLVKYDVDRKGQDSEVQVIDGYFVHYFVPENLETLPKHAIFVLDVSGSMSGEKIEQLKDSMFTVLDDMTENDYFNIITFSSGVNHWDPQDDGTSKNLVQGAQKVIRATKENKNLAIKHILGLQAGGGTNINDAMLEGVKLAEYALQNEKLPQEVKSMIVFLTDGLPSVGETNGVAIKSNIKNANSELDIPIFCIGFGRDSDFNLIKDISEQANSFSKKIYEGSDAALQLEDFYSEIASPLLSNLKFEYVGGLVDNTSISTASLKTFFKGGEYIIAGKLENKNIPENEFISIKVIGDGKTGPYERDIVICLRSDQEKEVKERKLLVPIIPPSACILPPSYPPRSLTQDFMQKLHAFINIKQLLKKSDLSTEESTNLHKEKALKLALDNNFVTDLTSLVVVRPDEKPTISSFEKPGSSDYGYPSKIAYRSSSGGNFFLRQKGSGISGAGGASFFIVQNSLPVQYDVFDLRSPDDISQYDTEDDYDLRNSTSECTGNLTLFSKTYLRGEELVLSDESADLEEIFFDNLSVSASVSGSCCWKIFSDKNFKGKSLLLSSKGTYTSVSSLGELFRETSAARKQVC
eukprot:GFUD01033850.1.p1 GENE.GFUD01033850.1~~GFUD01033850.1.p1  ORF type:complete len:834 (-),score=234.91 GFUD01033850.1:1233-3734(-)